MSDRVLRPVYHVRQAAERGEVVRCTGCVYYRLFSWGGYNGLFSKIFQPPNMFHRPQPVNLHVRAHPNCKKTGKHLQQRAFFGILYDNAYVAFQKE